MYKVSSDLVQLGRRNRFSQMDGRTKYTDSTKPIFQPSVGDNTIDSDSFQDTQ